jgi:uncharacterized protein
VQFYLASLFFPLFLLLACAHVAESPESVRNPQGGSALKIIDAHTHFHSVETQTSAQPSKAMAKEFEEAGVVGAIVHLAKDEHKGLKVDRSHKGLRLAVCAAIVPGGQSVLEVKKGIENGFYQCMKIYLGYIPKYPTDKLYVPYYQLAEKTGVPVVLHTGDTYDKMAMVKYADPLGVDEIAVTYPKAKFVIAHMGNPWFQSAAEVVYKNDNVYVDTSALLLGDVSTLDPESVEELVVKPVRWFFLYVENPKKFLFGSDYPLLKIKPYVEVIKRAIPKRYWNEVFYGNAASLFQLDKK